MKNLITKLEEPVVKSVRNEEEGSMGNLLAAHMHLVNELCQLIKRDAQNPSTEGGFGSKGRIREIGETLNKQGGMELMQAAYYAVRNSNSGYFSQDIWDGIGSWRC